MQQFYCARGFIDIILMVYYFLNMHKKVTVTVSKI